MKHSALNRTSLLAAVAAALLVWLLTAASVLASLVLILDLTSAPAGARVTGRTGGEGALSSHDPLATYLVASAVADLVTSPDDAGLVAIGRLVVDSGGNGQIAFVVPRVDPGPYVVMVHCPSCAATSAGRTMLPVAGFRVTASAPSTDTGPSDPPRLPNLGWLGTVLVAAVLGVVALRRRLAR